MAKFNAKCSLLYNFVKVALLLPKGSFYAEVLMFLHKIPLCKYCAVKRVHLLIIKAKFYANCFN